MTPYPLVRWQKEPHRAVYLHAVERIGGRPATLCGLWIPVSPACQPLPGAGEPTCQTCRRVVRGRERRASRHAAGALRYTEQRTMQAAERGR